MTVKPEPCLAASLSALLSTTLMKNKKQLLISYPKLGAAT